MRKRPGRPGRPTPAAPPARRRPRAQPTPHCEADNAQPKALPRYVERPYELLRRVCPYTGHTGGGIYDRETQTIAFLAFDRATEVIVYHLNSANPYVLYTREGFHWHPASAIAFQMDILQTIEENKRA